MDVTTNDELMVQIITRLSKLDRQNKENIEFINNVFLDLKHGMLDLEQFSQIWTGAVKQEKG